jgi:inorganic phosphate transporter, PiT family
MILVILLLASLVLALANGANDNFKGVATLLGSGTTSYRGALAWATATTLLGSLAAVLLAGALLSNFSGKGLVSDALVGNLDYAAAVALAAGATVLLATRMGIPISTTHSLVGAMLGAGLAAGSAVNYSKLGGSFVLPLLVGPLLAIAATSLVYPILRFARQRLGITAETCLCAGNEVVEIVPAADIAVVLQRAEHLTVRIGDVVTCRQRYQGCVLGVEAGAALDWLHYLSAGSVGFARGLNDTPKIAALLLLAPQLHGFGSIALVGIAIAIGGIVGARRVAETMSRKITAMNHGQGATGNVLTCMVVIGASSFGVPVSTTHVSCGALFGIGAVTRQARWSMIGKILAAWVTTLPLGAALGAASYWLIGRL